MAAFQGQEVLSSFQNFLYFTINFRFILNSSATVTAIAVISNTVITETITSITEVAKLKFVIPEFNFTADIKTVENYQH
jgi:hypothetical protein